MLTCLQNLKIYSKANPQATFADIEKKMREEGFKIYLIGMVSSIPIFIPATGNKLIGLCDTTGKTRW